MSDLEPTIYEKIAGQSARIPVPPGSADSVMSRGRRRRHRTRATAAVGASALVAAAVGGVALTRQGSNHLAVITSLPPAAGSTPSSSTPPSGLSWRTEPVTDGLYLQTSLASSSPSGPVYAVSTAPGVSADGNAANAVYRSSTGAEWTVVNEPAGLSAAGVASNGSAVYDVGTGPATAATSLTYDVGVASSTDQGVTWSESHLPLDLNAPNGALKLDPAILQVASAPAGEVVVVGAYGQLDLSKVLPTGAPVVKYWVATAQGVELLGSQLGGACGSGESLNPYLGSGAVSGSSGPTQLTTIECYSSKSVRSQVIPVPTTLTGGSSGSGTLYPEGNSFVESAPVRSISPGQAYHIVGSYSWSQLGITPQAATELSGQPLVFFSADGTHFQQVSLPQPLQAEVGTAAQADELGGPIEDVYLAGGPDGFALTAGDGSNSDANSIIWQSSNGRSWTRLPVLPSGDQIAGIGTLDGRLTAVTFSYSASGEVYGLVSGQWLPEEQIGGNLMVEEASFGPLGLAVLAGSANGRSAINEWDLDFSSNGAAWQSQDLAKVYSQSFEDSTPVVGSDSVVITVTIPSDPPTFTAPAKQVAIIGTPASA